MALCTDDPDHFRAALAFDFDRVVCGGDVCISLSFSIGKVVFS
ncbi:hypothetical protein EIO_0549 [Ketogulonicigenium vulgare Y25]|nr:hypothetical protein EIO_0549 [Ketogulonicigenium vulgare Y25]AOZ53642.1 hypothetical protein KVC_0618 [Ketogulonicigenium vulgare]